MHFYDSSGILLNLMKCNSRLMFVPFYCQKGCHLLEVITGDLKGLFRCKIDLIEGHLYCITKTTAIKQSRKRVTID